MSEPYCRERTPQGHWVTNKPFREWPWRARVVEKLYRWTHGGQIRTLVVRHR